MACELLDRKPRQELLEKLAAYLHQVNHAQVPQPERLSHSLYGVYKAHEFLVKQRHGAEVTNQLVLEAGVRVVDAACYLME